MVGRFAPSPTGRMHLGNVWTALLCWLMVRKQNGTLLLRMEDIDKPRCKPEYAAQLMADLQLLGLDWDKEPVWQSTRVEFYEQALQTLNSKGLLYGCSCTRAQLQAGSGYVTEASAPHAGDGQPMYRGICRNKGLTGDTTKHPLALRLQVPNETRAFDDVLLGRQVLNLAAQWGDFVVQRRDGLFAYQLACALDDAAMGVTLIVRGRDLAASTFPQMYIQSLLYPEQARAKYAHVPLLVDEEGIRLSKRQLSLDVGVLLQTRTPQEIVGLLGYWAGLLDRVEAVMPGELLEVFDVDHLARADVVVGSV